MYRQLIAGTELPVHNPPISLIAIAVGVSGKTDIKQEVRALNTPDVLFYVCANCEPEAGKIPRQWAQGDVRVKVQQLPCTGKVDAQYIMHALEGGATGVSILACKKGECHLSQGNYRADVRVKTTQRLLEEIGMEKERVSLLHYEGGGKDTLQQVMREEVDTLSETGKNPLQLRISAN